MKSFINEAINEAINDYLQSKNREEGILFNSFLVVVIRILINIYGDLDIIGPYQTNNEELFLNHLSKYGASRDIIDNLMRLLDGFYKIDQRNQKAVRREENVYFIEVQKNLIDLFNLKRVNYGTTLSETQEFYGLLYTPFTKNPLRLSYNYLNANNIFEIANYYQESLIKDYSQDKEFDLLTNDINEKMTKSTPVYNDYEIKVEPVLENNIVPFINEKITTGNGYVDILIIMSIIITVVMVIVIFSTLVF